MAVKLSLNDPIQQVIDLHQKCDDLQNENDLLKAQIKRLEDAVIIYRITCGHKEHNDFSERMSSALRSIKTALHDAFV